MIVTEQGNEDNVTVDKEKAPHNAVSDVTDVQSRVLLACITEPGHNGVFKLVSEFGAEKALQQILLGHAPKNIVASAQNRLAGRDPQQALAEVREQTQSCGARVTTPGRADWPPRLDDLALLGDEEPQTAPPLCLWVRGNGSLAEDTDRAVAIVGARDATGYGSHVTSELASELASHGWTVISGAAFGVDAAAHRGALAVGGVTVAVLANGVDTAYPKAHDTMLSAIAEAPKGLVVSEAPPGTSPQRYRFLVRNRLIAALAAGTVVVEAGRRSGSRLTARRAADLGRPLMAIPGAVTSAMSVGTHDLIREWGATLVTCADEIVAEVATLSEYFAQQSSTNRDGGLAEQPSTLDTLDTFSDRLLDAIPSKADAHPDKIAAVAGIAPRQARRHLPKLVMLGLVIETQHGYRLAPDALVRKASDEAITNAGPSRV